MAFPLSALLGSVGVNLPAAAVVGISLVVGLAMVVVFRYASDQKAIQLQAKTEEDMTEQKLGSSEKHEHRHQILTVAVTLLHISIAIATIAIVRPGTRWPWYSALALGALGSLGAAFAYV